MTKRAAIALAAVVAGGLLLSSLGDAIFNGSAKNSPESEVSSPESEIHDSIIDPEETTAATETPAEENIRKFTFTSLDDSEVEQFADEVQFYILDSDWASLAELLDYPISVQGVEIESATAFIQSASNGLFSETAISALQDASYLDMTGDRTGAALCGIKIEKYFSGGKELLHVTGINIE